jgi:hypothetical protein
MNLSDSGTAKLFRNNLKEVQELHILPPVLESLVADT